MNLNEIREQRDVWLSYKNILSVRKQLEKLDSINSIVSCKDTVTITTNDNQNKELIKEIATSLKPWRKGPFQIDDLFIDSEWKSNIKFDIIKKHFDIENKKVADVGCNNGYYMFKMLEYNPKSIVGFDPSSTYKTQFDFINHFVKSEIKYELLGVEHIEFYEYKFDVIFCLGVLYHRDNPIGML
ncbi:MAG: tRNA (5-methoxyuridine) 34 synthase, partial [uncultured Campylobacterales bacterium]